MAAAVSLETPSPLGDSHSGGDGGGCAVPPPATPGAPSAALASPKRVSFAAPPPRVKPAGSGNASQAAAALRRLRVELADAEFQGSPLVAAAADHALTFLPEVDSPRGLRLSPLTRRGPRPRLPCNEALYASDDEMARLDMSDLPSLLPNSAGASRQPSDEPSSPTAASSLAAAVLDLLPGQVLRARQRPPEQAQAVEQEMSGRVSLPLKGAGAEGRGGEEEAAGAAGVEPETPHGRKEEPAWPASPNRQQPSAQLEGQEGKQDCLEPAPAPLAAAPSLASRLSGLLARFLSAAATSGSSIAELTAAGSGALGSSRSWSAESLYSARSCEAERYHSCTASDLDDVALGNRNDGAELLLDGEAEAEAAASSLPAFSWHELP